MVVSYDFYDYPSYWLGREYENLAEQIALKKLFNEISKKNSLIDIGGGFGRLANLYAQVFKKCLIVDPSEKLLKLAQTKLKKFKNIEYKKRKAQKLPAADGQFDVALLIRVSHHLSRLEKVIQEAHRVLKPGGFLILEFANKIHLKSVVKAIFQRRLGYFLSHVPEDISSRKGILFLNYHPSHIKSLLLTSGFIIKQTLSVSNFRNRVFKKLIPLKLLLSFESFCQSSFACFCLGPSIFILAQREK